MWSWDYSARGLRGAAAGSRLRRADRGPGSEATATHYAQPENTMAYRAPVEDIVFTLKHAAGFTKARAEGLYPDLGDEDLTAVLSEAGRFASEVLAPLNAPGDRH